MPLAYQPSPTVKPKDFILQSFFPLNKERNPRDFYFLAAFGRLAPYFERRCVRLATPAVSSVPRTM